MEQIEIEKLCIDKASYLKKALKKMDEGARKILFVTENELHLFGVLSDGDIRRWILSTGELTGEVGELCNTNPIFVRSDYSADAVKELMLKHRITSIPVLDAQNRIVDILIWEDVFSKKRQKSVKQKIDVPVVIMAGGKGTRLDPFTRILPKPLIPIGDKPIIEIIIDRFQEYGASVFYISVNHKSKIIKAFFEELNHSYTVYYIEEDKPLGTGGSLKFLEEKTTGSFFVSNCDILIDADYSEILAYHEEKQNDITLVAAIKNYRIPYGVCEIVNGGTLSGMREKPEYDFLVNSGLYVLKSETLSLIPKNQFFHITDLMDVVKKNGGRIGVFPVSDKSWMDVGEWEEYKKTVERFNI